MGQTDRRTHRGIGKCPLWRGHNNVPLPMIISVIFGDHRGYRRLRRMIGSPWLPIHVQQSLWLCLTLTSFSWYWRRNFFRATKTFYRFWLAVIMPCWPVVTFLVCHFLLLFKSNYTQSSKTHCFSAENMRQTKTDRQMDMQNDCRVA